MKRVILWCIAATAIACHKSPPPSKLVSISSDSTGAWDYTYTGDQITGITADPTSNPHYPGYAQVRYTDSAGQRYVNVLDFGDSVSYLYALNNEELPTQISVTGQIPGYAYVLGIFIYQPGTDLLDSVIYDLDGYYKNTFKIAYTGQNITGMTERYISSDQNFIIGTYNFTYNNTANVFRKTDPLLYIYSYPFSALAAQPMVIAAFFAETFSANTLDSISLYSANFDSGNPGSYSTGVTCMTNADGKISAEVFSESVFEGLAGKIYVYH